MKCVSKVPVFPNCTTS